MATTYEVAGRTLLIHDREEWQNPARPISGPKPSPELVHHFVVHWPGAGDKWKPDLDVAAHLRWANDLYLLDPNRGYSYGYGFVIGPNPVDWDADPIQTDIWEVRGFDIRIASNDGDNGVYGQMANPNFNGRSISAQIMASTTFPATDDQLEQMRYLVAIADGVYGETLEVIPHHVSDATTCPGVYITSQVPLIATRPTPLPPPEENELTQTDIDNLVAALVPAVTAAVVPAVAAEVIKRFIDTPQVEWDLAGAVWRVNLTDPVTGEKNSTGRLLAATRGDAHTAAAPDDTAA